LQLVNSVLKDQEEGGEKLAALLEVAKLYQARYNNTPLTEEQAVDLIEATLDIENSDMYQKIMAIIKKELKGDILKVILEAKGGNDKGNKYGDGVLNICKLIELDKLNEGSMLSLLAKELLELPLTSEIQTFIRKNHEALKNRPESSILRDLFKQGIELKHYPIIKIIAEQGGEKLLKSILHDKNTSLETKNISRLLLIARFDKPESKAKMKAIAAAAKAILEKPQKCLPDSNDNNRCLKLLLAIYKRAADNLPIPNDWLVDYCYYADVDQEMYQAARKLLEVCGSRQAQAYDVQRHKFHEYLLKLEWESQHNIPVSPPKLSSSPASLVMLEIEEIVTQGPPQADRSVSENPMIEAGKKMYVSSHKLAKNKGFKPATTLFRQGNKVFKSESVSDLSRAAKSLADQAKTFQNRAKKNQNLAENHQSVKAQLKAARNALGFSGAAQAIVGAALILIGVPLLLAGGAGALLIAAGSVLLADGLLFGYIAHKANQELPKAKVADDKAKGYSHIGQACTNTANLITLGIEAAEADKLLSSNEMSPQSAQKRFLKIDDERRLSSGSDSDPENSDEPLTLPSRKPIPLKLVVKGRDSKSVKELIAGRGKGPFLPTGKKVLLAQSPSVIPLQTDYPLSVT